MRLDNYLVKSSICDSRNKAQELIKSGSVRVDKKVVTKPSFKCDNLVVDVDDVEQYVSRSALKLNGILDLIDLHVEGLEALDIGSSRGGFCEVLLQRGAKSVVALDVGTNQLHPKIHNNDRVEVQENQDVRTYKPNKQFELITCDVSFISLHNILSDIQRLSFKHIILLFKPQFEVGREVKRDNKGVVKDAKAVQIAQLKFEDATKLMGWNLHTSSQSILSGKDGNVERLYYFTKD